MARPPSAPRSSEPSFRWASPLDRGHRLVGRIWDVARARFVSEEALTQTLMQTPFIGLGEQHDNADHHLLQARVLGALIAGGRAPGVVFEMLERKDQSIVTRTRSEHPRDPDAIAQAVDWGHSGWPAWSSYRPVFAVAVENDLSIVAGGIGREAAMQVAETGWPAVAPELISDFDLKTELPPAVQDALRTEMRDVHCGLLPDTMLDRMVLVQRVRDAELAEGLVRFGAKGGGVLIAGNGHVRSDRGAPALLRRRKSAVVAVAFVEVRAEWARPDDYAGAFGALRLPFDYVWFTPRASDADHCAEVRKK